MANFRYKALTLGGAVITGTLEAPSQAAAVQQIRSQGHYPISATDAGAHGWRRWIGRELKWRRGPKPRDLAIATQELAMLLHAGLELDRALSILVGLGEIESMRQPLTAVLARVRGGASFADALAADAAFPKLYVSMVRAGEMGGNLEATLLRLAEYLTRAYAIREAITSALVYPIILLCTAGLSIIVILVFVLPEFKPLFDEAGKSLPLATQIVMGIGDFLGAYWWLLLFLIGAGVLAFRRALEDAENRRRWDAFKLRVPLLGQLWIKMEVEKFTRTLGTLLSNGVALPTALGMSAETLNNSIIANAVRQTAVSLREGEGLAARLARTKVFPAVALDFVRVGEETGKLDEMLLRQADLYERSVKHTIDRLLALLVPVLTILLGMVVAGLIASILVAILSINDLAM
jgi:general secretion pathway protein F